VRSTPAAITVTSFFVLNIPDFDMGALSMRW
jgi:hypothetical protein